MKSRLIPIAIAFLKLGFTAFGGPAVAYAMMRQEFVTRRKWISDETFFDYLGIANLVPGPNATEMAILIGFNRAGWVGMVIAGICYILPAMVIVLSLAWIYVRFGSLPELEGVLYGIKPVVVSVLISAIWGLLKPRRRNLWGMAIVVSVFGAYLAGVSPIILLLAGGALLGFLNYIKGAGQPPELMLVWLPFPVGTLRILAQSAAYDLGELFLVFLKAGAFMYGSGYVLLAFIHEDLVVRLGWLTNSQLVDAIAVGQVTPGPLSTTATFVGYLLGGVPAGLLATLAMFLPSFLFVGVIYYAVKHLRASERFSGILEGVNFAALGLMAGVTWEIGGTALVDPLSAGIAAVALLLLFRFDLGAPWLILGGAVIGLVRMMILG